MAISFEEAREQILDATPLLDVESVPLLDATGRVIAEDIIAPWDMPRWDNSAMDGFAARAEDCRPGAALLISGYIPAGATADCAIEPGTAVRIMTGAPTPKNCTAVIPLEDTEVVDDKVILRESVAAGDHIRQQGEDIPAGDLILARGTVLRPAEINVLASFSLQQVKVYRQPKVAILSTGDELVEPGEPIGPGQIVNSNAYSLAAAVKEAGGEPILLGIARDTHESLKEKLQQAWQADVLITSAGVSMGDRDLVCALLAEQGVEQLFWKVDIKPGRPTAFGLKAGQPVFSLPGNPVSTMVTFEEFVRPALLKMQGFDDVIRPYLKAIMKESTRKKAGRTQFMRVHIAEVNNRLHATSSGDQHTGILRTMLRANAIAVLPAERESISAGEEVDVHLLSV